MYALRLRSPHSNPRIFVKPILPSMTYVIVPRRFHDAFGHEINDSVELKDPVGNTFNLSYYYNQGDFRIGAGLFELRSVHQIETAVNMHFIYHGQARFSIQIFDQFTREIPYNLAPQVPPEVDPEVAAEFPPQMFHYIVGDEDNDLINTSSDEESIDEDEPAPWTEKIWESNITASHIYGRRSVTISSHVQQVFFPELPAAIDVLLPDQTISQWHITWLPPRNSNGGATGSAGRLGEFAAGWCDFYMSDFIRHGNSRRVHRVELWECSQCDYYIVEAYAM